jgi:hypothetical protein
MADDKRKTRATYVDVPSLSETFADSVGRSTFDGNTFRIEFTVTRAQIVDDTTSPRNARYPVCRLVLSPTGAVELLDRCQQLVSALQKVGAETQNARQADAATAS